MSDIHAFFLERDRLWRECGSGSESILLKRAVLRDLHRDFHREHSSSLALGKPFQARWAEVEAGVLPLFFELGLEGDLEALLLAHSRPFKRKKTSGTVLPKSLIEAIGAAKLMREDRMWELALAEEANRIGWKFWELLASVEISKSELWDQSIRKDLWPRGLILFSETDATKTRQSTDEPWAGRWILMLHPGEANPQALLKSAKHAKSQKWQLLNK